MPITKTKISGGTFIIENFTPKRELAVSSSINFQSMVANTFEMSFVIPSVTPSNHWSK